MTQTTQTTQQKMHKISFAAQQIARLLRFAKGEKNKCFHSIRLTVRVFHDRPEYSLRATFARTHSYARR